MPGHTIQSCAIIGAGPAGLAAAIALRKFTSKQPTIYELRAEPSTIGGAINMTPNALMLLKHLGIEDVPGCPCTHMDINSLRTGANIGQLPFSGVMGPAKRMLRADLQRVLLNEAQRLGVVVHFGEQLTALEEVKSGMELRFASGLMKTHDFVLGCDGIFSAVRKTFVDPDREPQYMGPAAAFAVVPAAKMKSAIPQDCVSVGIGPQGSFMVTYCNAEKTQVYFAVMLPVDQIPEGRKDWLIWKEDKEKTLKEVQARFGNAKVRYIGDVLDVVDELYLYPLVRLSEKGRWSRGRVLLMGDAAHALPPQGESTGFAIEDAVLLARVFSECPSKTIEEAFQTFEKTRHPRMAEAWKESNMRVERAKAPSLLAQFALEWLGGFFLKFGASRFQKSLTYDVRQEQIVAN